jgi:DNA-directed RNA polymerase specialized sigma24 family protein
MTLQPHVRMALIMRHFEGMTFEEMGQLLGEKPATLQARVARAMPGLRRFLIAKGVSREYLHTKGSGS